MILGKFKNKLFIFLAIELSFLVFSGWMLNSVWLLDLAIRDAQKSSWEMEVKIANYDRLKEERSKLEGEGKRLFRRFVTDDEAPVEFISKIEKAAEDSGVKLKLETYQEKAVKKKGKVEEKKGEGEALALILKTESGFFEWMRFLARIENLDGYSSVKKISLNFGKVEEDTTAPSSVGGEETGLASKLLGETIIVAY
jgi:hypothetical protein